MTRFARVAIAVLAFTLSPMALLAQTTPCSSSACPGSLTADLPRAIAGQTYTVNISDTFTAEQQAAIRSAFNNWQYSMWNTTGVRFTLTTGPNRWARYGSVEVYSTVGSCQPMSNLGCITPRSEGVENAFAINANGMMDPTSIANTIAHEIGHMMGLADCPTCCPGTSVMASPSGSMTGYPNGRSAPSACDAAKANEEVGGDPVDEEEPPPEDPSIGGGDKQLVESTEDGTCWVLVVYRCYGNTCFVRSRTPLGCW